MVKTVRILRIALPIAFVIFVIVLALSYTSTVRREQPPGEPVQSKLRAHDAPSSEARAFEDTQTIGGKVAFRIRADRMVSFESGWYTLEGVALTIFRKNGQTYDITARQAQVHAETRKADATGGIQVKSSDGISLRTEAIHYDGNRLTNDGPVQFGIDQWIGQAYGADLDVQGESVRLKRVDARSTPTVPNEPAVTMKSDELVFNRAAGDAVFRGHVVMTRGADRLTSEQMLARFDAKRKVMTNLEGTGGVKMHIMGSSQLLTASSTEVGQTMITAQKYFADFGQQGEITGLRLSGEEGLAVANMAGPPPRTISAKGFRVFAAGGNVSQMHADGQFSFREGLRHLTSDNAEAYFDPATRQPRTMVADRNVVFSEGARKGRSDRAGYDFVSRTMLLTGTPAFMATLQTESESIKAQRIELFGSDDSMKASGTVVAHLKPKQGAAASDTALFPEKGPVFVNSDSAFFRRVDRSATFSGNVRAWQGTNALLAKEMFVRNGGESLTATGGVRASLANLKPGQTSTMLARGDTMNARKSDRRVDLEGNVRIDDQQRTIDSQKASIFLDARQKIDRVEATGNVVMNEPPTGRKGTGDKAVYRVAKKELLLDGNPATVTDVRGTIRGQHIIADLEKNKVEVVSGSSPTQATYNPQQQ